VHYPFHLFTVRDKIQVFFLENDLEKINKSPKLGKLAGMAILKGFARYVGEPV
jgi:hypothetical protein